MRPVFRMALVAAPLFILFCAICAARPAFASERPEVGRVTFIVGEAALAKPDGGFRPADLEQPVLRGDRVRTGADSRCEVTLNTGVVVRMEAGSENTFDQSAETGGDSVVLKAGRVWLNARKIIGRTKTFRVRTKKAVCAIRGTVFDVAETGQATQVSVFEGSVETWSSLFKRGVSPAPAGPVLQEPHPVPGPTAVTMEEWTEIVRAFERITIDEKGGRVKSAIDPAIREKDPWADWNMARDNGAGAP